MADLPRSQAPAAGAAPSAVGPGPAGEERSTASQWQLVWWKFRKHKLAMASAVILALFYVAAGFCEFIAPYDPYASNVQYTLAPPTRIRFTDAQGRFHLRPFVYEVTQSMDRKTFQVTQTVDTSRPYPIRFFVRGARYKLWNLIPADIHLFGAQDGFVALCGTDLNGRDLFSRILYGSRISLSISLIGAFLSLILGIVIGGIAGYYGGGIDSVIQRVIETLITVPSLPLWMALSAALPARWTAVQVYFLMTIILSIIGWCGLARMVRGKMLSLREEDFVMAARLVGAGERTIIFRHLLPSFTSHIIATVTLSIPGMILGETSLSFLSLGLRPPAISWGVLLQDVTNISAIVTAPWLFLPAVAVVLSILCYNFVGDGLRDAADPYQI